MIKKIIIVVLIISFIGAIIYFVKQKRAKPAIAKLRAKPNSSWTNADYLKNGYTQKEIDEAKKLQSAIIFSNPFI